MRTTKIDFRFLLYTPKKPVIKKYFFQTKLKYKFTYIISNRFPHDKMLIFASTQVYARNPTD